MHLHTPCICAHGGQELHRELRARAASLALPPQHTRAYLGGEDDAAEAARASRLLLSPRLLDLSCAERELRPSARRRLGLANPNPNPNPKQPEPEPEPEP